MVGKEKENRKVKQMKDRSRSVNILIIGVTEKRKNNRKYLGKKKIHFLQLRNKMKDFRLKRPQSAKQKV